MPTWARTDKHRVAVWMSKVDMAWRTVNAVKMSKSVKALAWAVRPEACIKYALPDPVKENRAVTG